jgi:hypothetical protein
MLGLAGLNPARLSRELATTHNEVHRLVGRDLSGVILGETSSGHLDRLAPAAHPAGPRP